MSNGRKATTTRKSPGPPKRYSNGSLEPVRISTDGPAPSEDREPLFYIDDVEFSIPRKVSPNAAIKYLNDIRRRDSEYAVAQAMGTLLGEEAMDALAECDYITEEQMQQIMAIIEAKMMAAADKTLGNS